MRDDWDKNEGWAALWDKPKKNLTNKPKQSKVQTMILKKNQTIAVIVEGSKNSVTQTDAENLQYNLLGRGFHWFAGGQAFIDLSNNAQWVLFVNVKDKMLWWQPTPTEGTIKPRAYCVLRLWSLGLSETVKDILEQVKNPPPDYVEVKGVESNCDQKVRVYDDGDTVEFYEAGDHMLTTDKATIKGVAKELGLLDTGKVIVTVRFDYPSSQDSWTILPRVIQVTKMDSGFIYGVELTRGGDKTGSFKKYDLKKIRGDIEFSSFDVQE